MSRQSIHSPLSILLAGVIVIVVLLAGAGASTGAVTRAQGSTPTWTPCPDDEEDASLDCLDFRDDLTTPAEAATDAATATPTDAAYPYPSPKTPTTTTRAGSVTPTTTARAGAATPTRTPANSGASATSTPRATIALTPFEQNGDATEIPPTATPTPSDAITCPPGIPVPISGSGPAHAPLLLFFNQRAVAGGSAEADGSFALTLMIERERPGQYPVEVRVRGSVQVLRKLTCTVPNVTPTSQPLARQ